MRKISIFTASVLVFLVLQGCSTSRTEMSGKFNQPSQVNAEAGKVSVLFDFRHMTQKHGWDSIPKMMTTQGVRDFNDLFRDALTELSNVSHYDTFTELPTDVESPSRRQTLAELRSAHDYTITFEFIEEASFRQLLFNGFFSAVSLTVIPMPYSFDYSVTAYVADHNGKNIGTYQRQASLHVWAELFLAFAYPYHPDKGKREDIYSEALHDIFRQIETERLLKQG